MNLEFVAEAEARLFNSLDLGEAIAWAGKLAEDKRKIEAMKAVVDAPEPPYEPYDAPPLEAYEGICEPEQPAPAQPAPSQPIPADQVSARGADDKESVIADISSLLAWYPLPKLVNLRTALQNSRSVEGAASQRVMVIDSATQGQLDVIGKFCGLVGVTGTFKTGTLSDVINRECQRIAEKQRTVRYGK